MDRDRDRDRDREEKNMLESKREMEAENGRARMSTATAAKAEELISSSKRRKIHGSEIGENLLLSGLLLPDPLENSATPSSSLVMNGELSCEYVKSTDLKGGEDFETVASTFGEFSIETSPSGEIFGIESGEAMESSSSTTKRKLSPRKCCVAEMPSTAEIAEFFSSAEKSQQERFAKKYNYDIVKDVPMKGRYQWIPLIKLTKE